MTYIDKNTMKNYTQKSGFSILEILVVLGIIATMIALIGPRITRAIRDSKINSARTQMFDIHQGIVRYHSDTDEYPETLRDLFKKPANPKVAETWIGHYIAEKEVPKDPWGNSYNYKLTPGQDEPYDLNSNGPDGKKSTVKIRVKK